MVGRTVGNFRIVEKLGQGGMGSVFRAVDQMVQRNVAIKILRPDVASDPETWDRFHSEAGGAGQAQSSLHRHAVLVLPRGKRVFHGAGVRAREKSGAGDPVRTGLWIGGTRAAFCWAFWMACAMPTSRASSIAT